MILPGETKDPKENCTQCHFVHHKSHMDCHGTKIGLRGEKPATNRLCYGTAFTTTYRPLFVSQPTGQGGTGPFLLSAIHFQHYSDRNEEYMDCPESHATQPWLLCLLCRLD
jgi:hypothetical protein